MIKIEIEILVSSFLLVLTIEEENEVFTFDIPLKHETFILDVEDPKDETIMYYNALIINKINSINCDVGNGYSIDGYVLQREFQKVVERINHLFETPYKVEYEVKKNVKTSTFLKTLKGLGLPKAGKKIKSKISFNYGRN